MASIKDNQMDYTYRDKWSMKHLIDYIGDLEPCSRCGRSPKIYTIDPVGSWLQHVMPKDTLFFAARCDCGLTGGLSSTGLAATGKYIDEKRAAELAASNWNTEQARQLMIVSACDR